MPSLQGNVSEALDAWRCSVITYLLLGLDIVFILCKLMETSCFSGSQVVNNSAKQSKVRGNVSNQLVVEEVQSEVDHGGKFSAGTIPRYLNIEPSLAMDWLEISWDELNIKERVGAGILSSPV